jgi:hypothetical protein
MRVFAKPLVSVTEGDTEIGGEIGDGEVGKEDYGKIGRYAGF